jgi:hypothetical protein
MLNSDEKDWQIVSAGRSNMLLRVCHARTSVSKEHSEPIAWHNEDAYVDLSSLEGTSKVHHIYYEQVAARRHLSSTRKENPVRIARSSSKTGVNPRRAIRSLAPL